MSGATTRVRKGVRHTLTFNEGGCMAAYANALLDLLESAGLDATALSRQQESFLCQNEHLSCLRNEHLTWTRISIIVSGWAGD